MMMGGALSIGFFGAWKAFLGAPSAPPAASRAAARASVPPRLRPPPPPSLRRRQPGSVVMNREIEVEHLVQIEGIHSSNRHTQGITDKITDVMVFENGWAFGEQLTLVRLFHITFEGHQPVFTGLVQQVVHHFEGIDVSLPGVFGASENAANPAGNLFKDFERIAYNDATDARP